jgi:hypothetical protein
VDEAFELLNTAVSTPPSFHNQLVIGCPIYAIFMDYLESPEGQAFFANPIVNYHLKKVIDVYA